MGPFLSVNDLANIWGISLQGVYKRLEKLGIEQKFRGNKLYFDHNDAHALFGFEFLPKMYAVQIIKGGVGKTALAIAIAIQASLLGAKVLVVDTDKQGNATDSLKIDAEDKPVLYDMLYDNIPIEECIVNVYPGLDLLPSRIENGLLDRLISLKFKNIQPILERTFKPIQNNYDFILFDCPSDLGLLVAAIALYTRNIICPVIADKHSIKGLKLNYKEYHDLEADYNININKKIIFNKFDSRVGLSDNLYVQLLEHPTYKDSILKAFLRVNQDFTNSIAKGETIFSNLKKSTAKEDICLITMELLGLQDLSRNK